MGKNKLEQAAIDCFGESGSMCNARMGFIEGALWQSKQDELTWKDLQKLDIIANKLWQDGKYDKNDAQEFYTEVLKRFKEYKEQKNK